MDSHPLLYFSWAVVHRGLASPGCMDVFLGARSGAYQLVHGGVTQRNGQFRHGDRHGAMVLQDQRIDRQARKLCGDPGRFVLCRPSEQQLDRGLNVSCGLDKSWQ